MTKDNQIITDSNIDCPICGSEMKCLKHTDGTLVHGHHNALLFCDNLDCYGIDIPSEKMTELILTE